MRYALVCTACGHVVNVYDLDEAALPTPPEGHELIEDTGGNAGPGGLWDTGAFRYPPQTTAKEEPT